MPHTDIQQAEYIKSIWAGAYAGTVQVFDYTGETEAAARMQRFRYALYNYRRRIKRNKLRPELANEWSKLQSCEIALLTPTLLEVRLTNKLLYKRKQKKFNLTPELPFNFPTTLRV